MSGRTLNSAILLLVLGNFVALLSDVIIKWQGAGIAVFQFVFLRVLITLVLLAPFWSMVDRHRFFAGSRVHLVRAHVGLAGILCMIVALNTLPLATANAIFYAAPVLVMVLGVAVFGERLTTWSLVAVISGFAGVLVILRPVELGWASLSALGVAAALAINALLVRRLPMGQSLVHTLLLTHLYMLPAALALMLWEGAAFDPMLLATALGSAVFILGYNMSVLLAYRHIAANQVTSAEYTGLIWAMLVGWLWFAELPDAWFYLGSAMIVLPLLLPALTGQRQARRCDALS
jgi:drug/metabolite transporter (DMT)-like permease